MGNTPSFSNSSGNTSATGNGIVQADPMTNSLIITAPEAIYNNLRKVIDQLDKRRAQVYVEALITEVSTEKAAEIGIQWQAGKLGTTGRHQLQLQRQQHPQPGRRPRQQQLHHAPRQRPQPRARRRHRERRRREIANLNMLARFLESDTKANILSTPNLVTLDNEEAKIVVGRNVPFVTGSYATTGTTTTANPFTTVERKDVGLTLKVKPQISEGGTVRLQIYQEASAVIEGTATATTGPSTTKRSIESTVLVDDGAVIALGGLVEDTYSGGQEKVPCSATSPTSASSSATTAASAARPT
jgi:general secretion pathway protein D